MLSFGPSTRIFLAVDPCDMRKSFNGLFYLTEKIIGADPLSGHVFVFINKRYNRLKILFWDGSGLWVCAKKLERGTFSWPRKKVLSCEEKSIALRHEELSALLAGLDLDASQRRAWYRREDFEESSKTLSQV
jgi:transposase